MRYEKGHREKTRRHIVRVASRRFRKEGIDAVGISQLMADAGLTHGGFYNHFPSKEALAAETISASMKETLARLDKKAQSGGGLTALVDAYLDPRHVKRPEDGCALAALLSEATHAQSAIRDAAAAERDRFVALIASYLAPEDNDPKITATAAAMLSAMIGTVQLARLSKDPKEVQSILEDGKAAIAVLEAQVLR